MENKEMNALEGPNSPENENLPTENSREELVLSKREITLFPRLTSEDEIVTSFPFFLPAAKETEDGWENSFVYISNYLRREGFSSDLQRIALITQIALNSAHLDNPVGVELFENPSGQAATIINTCAELTPEFFVKRCSKLTPDDFLRQKDQWKGISILGIDSTGFEKVQEKLNQFLTDQKLVEETIERTKKRDIPIRYELEGPTACVFATKDARKRILTRPSFLHFHLPATSMKAKCERDAAEEGQMQGERDAIKISFERLSPHIVKIPFGQQFSALLQQSPFSPALEKIETFLKMIRVITIINYSPPLTKREVVTRLYRTDPRIIDAASGLPTRVLPTLIAGKLEYYIFRVLMSGLLRKKGVPLTAKQNKLFQTIKNRNIGRLPSVMTSASKNYEKLAVIAAGPQTWATRDQLFEDVNQGPGEPIEDTYLLFLELQALAQTGVIREKKIPDLGDSMGYFVTRFDIDDIIPLPKPDEVCDSSCGEGKITVQNPITAEWDEV